MYRLMLAIILALPSTLSAQSFTYAPINVPGAVLTQARGINNSGEVVGFYETTTACIDPDVRVPTCPTKGFKLVNGSYVKLMVPNSVSTAIMGVNDYGDLTGFYKKSDGSEHGFIWYHTNVVRTIDFQRNATVPWAINKAGVVVGQTGTFPSGGWIWINGKFSNMNPNNGAAPCCESVTGVSNNGILSGLVFQADRFMAWMKKSTDEDFFTYPTGTETECCDTNGTGVNNSIDMIGFTGAQGWFTKHIELNEVESAGETTPKFINVNFPGKTATQPPAALPTYPFGLNDKHWIAGTYTDSANHTHGFVAKPNF